MFEIINSNYYKTNNNIKTEYLLLKFADLS